MSTKSTIILSKDNEHWYSDCSAPRGKIVNGKVEKYYGDDITLEIDKANIVEKVEDSDGMYIVIRGDSDLARKLSGLVFKSPIKI